MAPEFRTIPKAPMTVKLNLTVSSYPRFRA